MNKAEMKKVLLVKTRAMGDTILSTAALNSLRDSLPDSCQIHVMAPAPWHVLLEEHPSVDRLWVVNKKSGLIEKMKQIRDIRRERFDAVFALHASNSTAWIAKLSGAPNRSVHFHGITDSNRFSTVEISGKGQIKPILERDFDAIKAIVPAAEMKKTSLVIAECAKNEAQKILDQKKLKSPYLVIGLGASRPAKMWPVERFHQLAQRWISEKKGSVIVIAGPDESELASSFANDENTLVRLGGDLMVNAGLIARAEWFIGNDSGPKHLAVALGVKTLTLFGPENPFEWHPYDRKAHPVIFIEGLSCRKALAEGLPEWCGIHQCVEQKHRCMREISVDQVRNKLWER